MTPKPPKPKKCKAKGCGVIFTPHRMGQKACGPACAQEIARAIREQGDRQKMRDERKADREKRDRMKTHGEWEGEAQRAFNKMRRLQLHAQGHTCMSCQRPRHEIEQTDGWKPGGAWDAGHFLSVGSHPELRFEPDNVWLQCKSCNAGSGKYTRKARTVAQDYETNLRALIGDERVDWLKGPHAIVKRTKPELEQLRNQFRALANALQKEAAE